MNIFSLKILKDDDYISDGRLLLSGRTYKLLAIRAGYKFISWRIGSTLYVKDNSLCDRCLYNLDTWIECDSISDYGLILTKL